MKKIIFKKILKFIGIIILTLLALCAIVVGYSWYHYERGFQSVDRVLQDRVFSGVDTKQFNMVDISVNRRTGNTFMSIPEWYIVTISDDYTKWLEAGNNPSNFPYFQYLNDMWYIYGRITALMDGIIPRDYEYHTMVRVIGISTTLEFGLKSFYENTLGRITAFLGYDSPEDTYYQTFSRKYVEFILLRPWYEFPFSETRDGYGLSSYTIRSIERYMIHSIEFFTKMHYAKLIEDAAHANFAIPDIWTGLGATFSSGTIEKISSQEVYEGGIKIPRYYPFTQIFPQILKDSTNTITSIAGNTHIVSEFVQDEYGKDAIIVLPVPIQREYVRAYYYTNIDTLRTLLSDDKKTLIHLYDF